MKKYIVLIIAICSTPLFSANKNSNGRTLPTIPTLLENEALPQTTTWPPNALVPLLPLLITDEESDNSSSHSSDDYYSSDEFSYENEWESGEPSSDSSDSDGASTELPDIELHRLPVVSGPGNIPQSPSRRAVQASQTSFPTRFTRQRQHIPTRLTTVARAGMQTRNLTLHERIGRFNYEMERVRARGQDPSPLQIRMRAALQREVFRLQHPNAMDLEASSTGYFVHNPDGAVYISYESDDE